MKRDRLLMAAVAGLTLGLSAPSQGRAEEKKDEVKCYGINGCGSHAKCSVTAQDLDAVKALLGEKDYASRFGKSEAHSCGAHAKCGASSRILNWVPAPAGQCHDEGGFVIEETAGKKVARKA